MTSIGVSAFYDCSGLISVTIPNSVTSIGYGAFSFCRSLASISVGSGNAIYDSRDNCNAIIETSTNTLICGCQNTIIPNSVTNIDVYALLGCLGLTSITISNNVKSIGNGAFSYCTDLESITIALGNAIYDSRDNCNAIIETATNTLISGCKNTIIPNSITSIGEYSFFGCLDLTSVTIPYSVKSIGDYAFRECSGLKSVTIPNSVKSIGQQAFFDSSVTSVTIGNNVKSIDRQAFFCPIENVYCYAEQVPNATIGSNPAFYHKTIANATLHVPATSIDDYKAAETWKEFGSIVALTDEDPSPTGITNIYQDSATERQYYSLDGKRSSTPLRGLNIIKMSNGTTRKVVIR